MPVEKNEFPILEYDVEKQGVISPNRSGKPHLPGRCVMTFFGDVLSKFVEDTGAQSTHQYVSEMRPFPVYELKYKDTEICVVQAPVGSAVIAAMTDYLIGYGVTQIVACGGCGVLSDIPLGDVIVPVRALRDEGASYHYLPPSRTVDVDPTMVAAIEATLEAGGVPFIECMTWTTDGFFRETPDMIAYRKEEGCQTVEMECATLAAVAQFRGIQFGQLLYSGDLLTDPENYDERDWAGNQSARERLFTLALETAVRL